MDGNKRKPVLESWTEKGKPTKDSVSISYCCLTNHSKTQGLKTRLEAWLILAGPCMGLWVGWGSPQLSTYYVPVTVLGDGETARNKAKGFLCWSSYSSEKQKIDKSTNK